MKTSGFSGSISRERLRKNTRFPSYARKLKYWVSTIMLILFGGIFALLLSLSGDPITPLNAFVLGLSTPSLPHKLAKFLPEEIVAGDVGNDSPKDSIRNFLAF